MALWKKVCFKNGHNEVGMLWKDLNIYLKNNKVLAVQRLESLEKNSDKAKQYSDTIKKYLELGHATKLSTTESTPTNNVTYYIPHHYVTSPNKQNNFRVVFDASTKFLTHLIQRFKRYNKKIDKLSEPTKVVAEHMKNTHDVIIELIQKEAFKQELEDLFSSSQVNQNSKLVTLNPILDNNIIKVGGRLKNIIDILNNLKHQIIFPRHPHVIDLLILHYHKSNHHCGRDQTLALHRERYWIVKAKSIIRKVLSTCLLCKHSCSMPKPQFMGNLQKERTAVFKPPFTITGVNCFGPVTIKQYKRTRTSNNNQIKR